MKRNSKLHVRPFPGRLKPPKTNLKMGKTTFEDVTPMKNGDFPFLCSSNITFYRFSLGVISSGGRSVGQKSGLKKWNLYRLNMIKSAFVP